MHIYVFSAIYYVSDGGKKKRVVRAIFSTMLLLHDYLVLQIYKAAIKKRNLEYAFTLTLAIASIQTHEVYASSFFSDGVVALFCYAAVLALLKQYSVTATVLISIAIGLKMNALLYLPCFLLVIQLMHGLSGTICSLAFLAGFQIIIAAPFL